MYKHKKKEINVVSQSTCKLLDTDALVYMTNHHVGDHVTRDGAGYATPSSDYVTGYNYNAGLAKVAGHLKMDLHYSWLDRATQKFVAQAVLLEFLVDYVGAHVREVGSPDVTHKLLSNMEVVAEMAAFVFSGLEGLSDVNYTLCHGIKPVALFYSFYKGGDFTSKLQILVGKGADLTEREFIQVHKVNGKFSEYELTDGALNLESFSLTPSHLPYKAESITHYYERENFNIEDATNSHGISWAQISPHVDTRVGFGTSDAVYATMGLVGCLVKMSGNALCGLVPAVDMALDYLGVTSKYLVSSYFVVSTPLSAGLEVVSRVLVGEDVRAMNGLMAGGGRAAIDVANHRIREIEEGHNLSQYVETGVSLVGAYFAKDAYDGVVDCVFGAPELDASQLEMQ